MQIKEAMTKNPITINQEASAIEAAEAMRDNDIGSLPVVGDGKLVGFVTDRDIVIRCVAKGKNPSEAKIRDVMTPEIYFCNEGQSAKDAMDIMAKHQVQRLPVLDSDDKLTGIVTLGALAGRLTESKEVLKTIKSVREPVNV